MEEVVIFGTGKIADVVYYYMSRDKNFKVVAFTVDEKYITSNTYWDIPVVPFETVQQIYPPDKYKMFVALGYQDLNALRTNRFQDAKAKGYNMVSYVNKNSGVLEDTVYGENCFIMHNVAIHPLVKIGNNVFVWTGAVICHHSVIEDNCWLTAGANIMGGVRLGANTFVAGNAMVTNAVTIGKDCFLGANTLVTKDLKDGEVVVAPPTPVYRLNSKQFLQITRLN